MSREAFIQSEDLKNYRMKPNIIYQAFEADYCDILRPTESLINHEQLKEWYIEEIDTIENLIKFVTSPPGVIARLCILHGWTGSGKTTNVRVLFEKMRDRLPDNLIYFYIHCAVLSPIIEKVEQDYDNSINDQLIKLYPQSYYKKKFKDDTQTQTNEKRIRQLIDEGKLVVIVWDNLDQCSRGVQMECLRLAYHNLHRIKRLRIIIPIREYNYKRTHSEEPLATYAHYPVSIFPIDFNNVIKAREELTQKSLRNKGIDSKPVPLDLDLGDGISITIGHGKEFLKKVTRDLCQHDVIHALSSLSNSNINIQLNMVHCALKTPYITRRNAFEVIRKYIGETGNEGEILMPYHKFIEGLIIGARNASYSIFSFNDSLLINMFDSGVDDFYNTLNRHHVAEIVSRVKNGIKIESIFQYLEAIGHNRDCTSETIREFMHCGMVWSEEGNANDYPQGITTIKPNKATSYYLRNLMYNLMYLQHMGLVTPLEHRFKKEIHNWPLTSFSSLKGQAKVISTFKDRMTSARALMKQIESDEDCEVNLTKKSSKAFTIMKKYGFGNISSAIARNIISEISSIRNDQNGITLSNDEWDDIIGEFQETAKRDPII